MDCKLGIWGLKLVLCVDKLSDRGMLGGRGNVVGVFMSHAVLGGIC